MSNGKVKVYIGPGMFGLRKKPSPPSTSPSPITDRRWIPPYVPPYIPTEETRKRMGIVPIFGMSPLIRINRKAGPGIFRKTRDNRR